jgi:hypothetical protein
MISRSCGFRTSFFSVAHSAPRPASFSFSPTISVSISAMRSFSSTPRLRSVTNAAFSASRAAIAT